MIAACLKWVDQRPEVDAAGNPAEPDARFAGVSAADQAALEWALRCRDSWPQQTVVAITVGPPAADVVLVVALAAGANRAVRIDATSDTPSRTVARLIAEQIADAALVICGDYSFDSGTGSVPAFLAAELGIAQALGLVDITFAGDDRLNALRRLDGGSRDRLAIALPAVLSVEGSTAMLRRAPLRSILGRRSSETITPSELPEHQPAGISRPFRPRPRVLAAPAGATALDRVKALTAANAAVVHGDPIILDPDAAAGRILAALEEWSYLPS